ncbi:unnamed protein product [Boreogadus saida]
MAPFTKRRATSAARAVLAAGSRSVVSTNPGSEPSGRRTCAHALSAGCSHSARTRLLTSHKLLKGGRGIMWETRRPVQAAVSTGSGNESLIRPRGSKGRRFKQVNQRPCEHVVRPPPYSHRAEGGKEATWRNAPQA